MTYDPQRHHRRSIRLHGYDYTQAGAYFVTICAADGACLFGEALDTSIRVTAIGEVVADCWMSIPAHSRKSTWMHSL
jgi:hypothetical protein